MTPGEFRANAAGYLDSATVLVDQVVTSLRQAASSHHVSIPAQLQAPTVLFEQLAEARHILQQCAEWMVSPHNAGLERHQ